MHPPVLLMHINMPTLCNMCDLKPHSQDLMAALSRPTATPLTARRVFLAMHHVSKELASKRLASDQRVFAEVGVHVIMYVDAHGACVQAAGLKSVGVCGGVCLCVCVCVCVLCVCGGELKKSYQIGSDRIEGFLHSVKWWWWWWGGVHVVAYAVCTAL